MKEAEQVLPVTSGPSVLMAKLCDEIGLEDLLNEQLEWDPKHCHLSPGTRIKSLVLNVLSGREPLYQVEEFYKEQDVELLFGQGVQASDFNDDALGRALDKLYDAEPWKVYSHLAISALAKLGLTLGPLHNDTTSISVFGEYDRESALNVTYGHSKDHRPDLKQILLGMGVTPQKIPVLAQVENGNESDKTWNMTFIKKLRESLSAKEWEKLIYVADSALITKGNLKTLRKDVTFVSRLPDNFAIGKRLKAHAWEKDDWQDIGAMTDEKDAAVYKLQAIQQRLDGCFYRFVIVYSSQLDQRKAKSFEKALDKEREGLEKAFEQLHKKAFQCEADARQAMEAFQKDHQSRYFRIQAKVQGESQPISRKKRGRPKKNESMEMRTVYRIERQGLDVHQNAIEEQKRQLATFVLITNEYSQYTDQEILEIYKGQSAAETRFKLLKDPAMLDAVYVKYPERIEALGIVFVMALLLYGMLEYRVREAMKKARDPLLLPGKRKSFRPTGQVLLKMLHQVKVLLIRQGGETQRLLASNFDEHTQRVVEMTGYDLTIYTEEPKEKSTI